MPENAGPIRRANQRRIVNVRHPSWKRQVGSAVLCAGLLITATVQGQESRATALLHEYKCYICHSDNEAKAGPAYVDVAAKYRNRPNAVATVAAVVRKGAHGGGPWHMPPHPEVSSADARTIANYILSLK
jgi:cytochrome c